ncbi:MAG: COX15/CtaA family protein [Hyphomicrobiales bacterium]
MVLSSTNTPTEKQIKARPAIQLWLFMICALIFAMVIVGGATRLTGSGLSITEWKPIVGAIPPLNVEDWNDAFEKYKQIPQYTRINEGMSLNEFKSIFWWEWAHRFLGRFIGVAFLLPFLFFLFTKRVESSLKPKFWLMFLGGGLQGFVGWYMVASGLTERVDVSQYRLAAHLGLAVLLFSYIFWVAIGLRRDDVAAVSGGKLKPYLKSPAYFITGLIFFQIIAGAFVAGLKAGKVHNTWPLMDGRFIPNGLDVMTPFWKNLFENVLTVQFNHRMIAYVIAIVVLLHFIQCLISKSELAIKGAMPLLVLTFAQIALGIVTLLQFVPLDLALYHQGGAVILLSVSLWHSRNLYSAVACGQPEAPLKNGC